MGGWTRTLGLGDDAGEASGVGVGIAHDLSQGTLHGPLHATGGQAGVLRGLQLQQRAAALADHRRLLDIYGRTGKGAVMMCA